MAHNKQTQQANTRSKTCQSNCKQHTRASKQDKHALRATYRVRCDDLRQARASAREHLAADRQLAVFVGEGLTELLVHCELDRFLREHAQERGRESAIEPAHAVRAQDVAERLQRRRRARLPLQLRLDNVDRERGRDTDDARDAADCELPVQRNERRLRHARGLGRCGRRGARGELARKHASSARQGGGLCHRSAASVCVCAWAARNRQVSSEQRMAMARCVHCAWRWRGR